MIEKLAINQGIIAPKFDSRKDENSVVTVPAINIKDIAPRTNKACHAYGMAMVRKPIETLTLDDCIRQLRKDGKRPGKDFILERDGRGFAQIKIKNLYGQPTKIISYKNRIPIGFENRRYAGIQLIKAETHTINK